MTSSDVARVTVHLGDHNIRTAYETQHIAKKVKRVVRHRSFDSRTLYNDVALLTLDSPVQFNSNVRPICLPRSNEHFGGSYGTVIGWGSLRESMQSNFKAICLKVSCWNWEIFNIEKKNPLIVCNLFNFFVYYKTDHNRVYCKKCRFQSGQMLNVVKNTEVQRPVELPIRWSVLARMHVTVAVVTVAVCIDF